MDVVKRLVLVEAVFDRRRGWLLNLTLLLGTVGCCILLRELDAAGSEELVESSILCVVVGGSVAHESGLAAKPEYSSGPGSALTAADTAIQLHQHKMQVMLHTTHLEEGATVRRLRYSAK